MTALTVADLRSDGAADARRRVTIAVCIVFIVALTLVLQVLP